MLASLYPKIENSKVWCDVGTFEDDTDGSITVFASSCEAKEFQMILQFNKDQVCIGEAYEMPEKTKCYQLADNMIKKYGGILVRPDVWKLDDFPSAWRMYMRIYEDSGNWVLLFTIIL